jgi:hypothetical protein
MDKEAKMSMIAAVLEMDKKGGPEEGCQSIEEWVAYARVLYPPDYLGLCGIVECLNGERAVDDQESAKQGIKDAHALVMQQLKQSNLLRSIASENSEADGSDTEGNSLVTSPSKDVMEEEEEEEEEEGSSRGSLSSLSETTGHQGHEDEVDCLQQ